MVVYKKMNVTLQIFAKIVKIVNHAVKINLLS